MTKSTVTKSFIGGSVAVVLEVAEAEHAAMVAYVIAGPDGTQTTRPVAQPAGS